MMSVGFGMFGLLGFAVLAAQVVGLVGLAKVGRTSEWWVMVSGIACNVLGMGSSVVMMGLMFSGWGSGSAMSDFNIILMASAGLNGLGGLLFAAGFGMHGMRAGRISKRHTELEMLVQAQTEEIRRLSAGV